MFIVATEHRSTLNYFNEDETARKAQTEMTDLLEKAQAGASQTGGDMGDQCEHATIEPNTSTAI